MKVKILRPWVLGLIPVLIFLIIYFSRYLKLNKLRKKFLLIIRNILIVLLVFSLSGISIIWSAKDTTTIFLVDSSDSMKENKTKVEGFIKDALKYKESKDFVGIMSFGDNVLVDSFVSKKNSFSSLDTEPNGTHTNIENALTNALTLIPDGTKKRIVLITDGKENGGKGSKLIPTLKEQGVDLKVYNLNNKLSKNEVAIEDINIPQNVRIGQEFSVAVNINSNINTESKVTLFSGNAKRGEQKVKLNKGNNRFVFRDIAESGGFKTYKAVIEPVIDSEVKNNEVSTFTSVRDKAKILVIKDKEKECEEITKMLKASNMDFDVVGAGGEPTNIKALSNYKSIITCNVSCENLSQGFLNSLKSYVKDLGGGFIAVGGDNSFALGGYSKTPLEDVLPVYMDMRGKKEVPDMSMMLVIDRSGSMEGTKMELAKEAAARTVDFLRSRDEMGVLAFDDAQYWVVKRQKVTDKNAIRENIGTIRGGGGTSILPALYEAYDSLKESKAKIKHIILLTDGQAEREGYDTLISDMNKQNITVSTVSVGQDADTSLLKTIAERAKGRYYYTDQFTNIPRIFAKETFMISKTYLNNGKFTPVVQSAHATISGVYEGGMPSLLGYIGSTPKNTSKVVLKSYEDDPILTVWQYGLGKSVAWNSDMNGKWSANYIGWDKNVKMWQNIINWTIENYTSDNMEVNTKIDGNKGLINIEDKSASQNVEVEGNIITPSMKNVKVKLYPSNLGKFTGDFDLKETGAYIIKVKELKNGEVINTKASGLVVQYSPEYKLTQGESTLNSLVKETDGKFIKSSDEVFKGMLKDNHEKRDIGDVLLVMALILFVLDIAIRRINLPYEKMQNKLMELKNTFRKYIGKNKKDNINTKHYDEISNRDIKGKMDNVMPQEEEKIDKKQEIKKQKKKDSYDDKVSLNTSELLKIKDKKKE